MIPEDWHKVRIKDIATVTSGGTPSRQIPSYWNGEIPWVTTSLINFNTITAVDECITAEGLANSSAKLYPVGTILMAMYGQGVTRGRVAILGLEATTNQACAAIQAKRGVDNEFLFYFLASKYLELRYSAHGSNQDNLNGELIKNFRVVLPPLPEQRKIAEILSTWDEAITKTEALIAALQTRKKGLMQKLLTGEVRFPGFEESKTISHSKIGNLPVDWKVKLLQQIADVFFSNVDKVFDEKETPVRLCNYMDVFGNFFITNDMSFMDGSANEREIQRFSLQVKDVIITKDSETAEEIAEAAVVSEDLENVVCGYHLAVLRPNSKIMDGTFLMYMLHEPNVHLQFVRSANGITRYGLTTGAIQNALIPVPTLEEQHRITDLLKTADQEIDLHTQKLAALQQQKKGLMQRLLTGEVRV